MASFRFLTNFDLHEPWKPALVFLKGRLHYHIQNTNFSVLTFGVFTIITSISQSRWGQPTLTYGFRGRHLPPDRSSIHFRKCGTATWQKPLSLPRAEGFTDVIYHNIGSWYDVIDWSWVCISNIMIDSSWGLLLISYLRYSIYGSGEYNNQKKRKEGSFLWYQISISWYINIDNFGKNPDVQNMQKSFEP